MEKKKKKEKTRSYREAQSIPKDELSGPLEDNHALLHRVPRNLPSSCDSAGLGSLCMRFFDDD